MSELGIKPAQVTQALQSENANVPGGFLDVGARSFSLKTSGSYSSLDQIKDTVVAAVGGLIVRVRDVAEVSWQNQPLSYIGRFNGKRAVLRNRESEGRLQHSGCERTHRDGLEALR